MERRATATKGSKKDPMSPGRYYSGSRSRAGTSKAVGRGSKELSSASQGYPPDKRRARAARLKYEARLRKEREANRNKK